MPTRGFRVEFVFYARDRPSSGAQHPYWSSVLGVVIFVHFISFSG